MATVFRAPLIQRIERRNLPPAVHDVGWQNRLVTLFGAATPFVPLEWPTPRRVRGILADLGGPSLLATLLGVVVADPFLALDWPTPRRRAAAVIDPGWQNHLSTLLAPAVVGTTPFRTLVGVGL